MTFPKMLPTASELLDALAYEMTQHDALRDSHGLPPRNGTLKVTNDQLAVGHRMCPTAVFSDSGELVVHLES